jgi:hypothetical protein
MDAPERYEQLIAFLDSHLGTAGDRQENADGSLQFTGGDPPEVVVLLTETSVVVAEYAAVWDSQVSLTPKPRRVGILKWRRLPETALFNALGTLIKGAREARLSRFRVCQICGRTSAPEWMDNDNTCTSCAEREHSRVH